MGFLLFCMPKISTRIWIWIGIWVRVLVCRVWSLCASEKSCYFTRFSAVHLALSLHIFRTKQLIYEVLIQYFSTFFLNPLCDPLNHGGHCVCETPTLTFRNWILLTYCAYLYPIFRIILSINIVISLYGFDRLVFVIETYCVDCEVLIDLSHIIFCSSDFFFCVRSAFVFENVTGPKRMKHLCLA